MVWCAAPLIMLFAVQNALVKMRSSGQEQIISLVVNAYGPDLHENKEHDVQNGLKREKEWEDVVR